MLYCSRNGIIRYAYRSKDSGQQRLTPPTTTDEHEHNDKDQQQAHGATTQPMKWVLLPLYILAALRRRMLRHFFVSTASSIFQFRYEPEANFNWVIF